MQPGDLVIVKKGYTLKPSPQTGDVGIILSKNELAKNGFFVLIPYKFFKIWQIDSDSLEVINES